MAEEQHQQPLLPQEATGTCVVCKEAATLRCAGCRLQFYCGKEHQKQHWTVHRTACRAWEVRDSPGDLGRHLVASRDLQPGDLICSEQPLVWGPLLHGDPEERSVVCVGCGRQPVRTRCPGCAWPACSATCDGLLDETRHGAECAFLLKSRVLPRSEILLVIRILLLRRKNPKAWATLSRFKSHEEARGEGTEAYDESMRIGQQLVPFLQAEGPQGQQLVARICGLVDVNALETNPPEGCAAIYETASLLEHNCLANTRHEFQLLEDGGPKITVRAATRIAKGEHLSTTYTHVLWSTMVRRSHLRATKYFDCRCERCRDPSEFGTHLGTLKCLCGNGWILPKDPLDFETEWGCGSCPALLSAPEVAELTERLGEEVDKAMAQGANKDVLADFLSRLTVLLHPGHQHCISLSHSLIQLLEPDDPQKVELCKRIIDTTGTLDPYGARLSLYSAIAYRELAFCPGQDKQDLLSRAAMLLKSEPEGSPGDKLFKLVQSDLLR